MRGEGEARAAQDESGISQAVMLFFGGLKFNQRRGKRAGAGGEGNGWEVGGEVVGEM